jgi:Flp pilus assembly pilin Flp
MTLAQRGMQNADEAGAAAMEYLHLLGYVALGHMWLLSARTAKERRQSGGALSQAFYAAKLATARFYMQRMLPQTAALFATVSAGSEVILQFDPESF